jgi:LysM repeat protein
MRIKFYILVIAAMLFLSCTASINKVSMLDVTKDERALRKDVVEETKKAGAVASTNALYEVVKGDTLWKISKKLYGRGSAWEKLASINSIAADTVLQPGMKLKTYAKILKTEEIQKSEKPVKESFVYRVFSNTAFGVGEKLTFAVKYFNVTAGLATLEVKSLEDYKGHQVYHIDATARTAPFFETFYRVKDVISTYMDVKGLYSWKYSKVLEEGGYRNNTVMEFNHEGRFAVKNNGDKCDIPSFVQDVLSEFYYFRSAFNGSTDTIIDVASDECKTYQILVKKVRYEKVTIDAGTFDCVVVQPFLKFEGIFRQKGDVLIWLTNDKNLMPVMIKSQISIGTVDVILQDASVVKAE